MTMLYLTDDGLYCHKEGNRVEVMRKAEVLKKIPIEKIEGIVLSGKSYVSSPLMNELLEREIPLTWLSSTGKFFGRLEPTSNINIERQREQFRRGDDPEFCLSLAKSFIKGKINNSIVVLRRYNKNLDIERVKEICERLKGFLKRLVCSSDMNQIMGYEGNASKLYFEALSLMVSNDFKFKGRSKRPPKDPFNSLLSLGYTLLLYEIYTAVACKGLHPYAGFMHKIRRGHPALASDLIEEWRPVLIDSMVMSIVQNQRLCKEDFDYQSGGVFLKKIALKEFISRFERRIPQTNNYLTYVDFSMSFRESFLFQAGALAKSIEENDPTIYRPVLIR